MKLVSYIVSYLNHTTMKYLLLLMIPVLLSCSKDKSEDPIPMTPTSPIVPPVVQKDTTETTYFLDAQYQSGGKLIIVIDGDTLMNENPSTQRGWGYIPIVKRQKIDYDASGGSTLRVIELKPEHVETAKVFIDFGVVSKGTLDLSSLPK